MSEPDYRQYCYHARVKAWGPAFAYWKGKNYEVILAPLWPLGICLIGSGGGYLKGLCLYWRDIFKMQINTYRYYFSFDIVNNGRHN